MRRSGIRTWSARLAVAAPALLWPVLLCAAEPPTLSPREYAKASPSTWYQWNARAGPKDQADQVHPLRYCYAYPADLQHDKPFSPRTICIILPDLDQDHLSLASIIPPNLRPADVLITVEGFSASPGERATFDGTSAEVGVLRAFALEMSRTFPTARIMLIGVGQGGLFAAHFSGEMGRMIDGGVVAVGSGLWNWSRTEGPVQSVPLALLHAVDEPLRPYQGALAARDGLVARGFKSVALRRIAGASSLDAQQLSACIDWCLAMRTEKADEALAAARAMLAAAPPAIGLARMALHRFEGPPMAGPPFFSLEKDSAIAAAAWNLSVAIEAHAQLHVDAIRARVKSVDDLRLPDKPESAAWIGHLIVLREDMRGVTVVEHLIEEVGFDRALVAHAAEAQRLLRLLASEEPPVQVFAQAVESLPKCFLFEGLPPDLLTRLDGWAADARSVGISEELAAKWASARVALAGLLQGRAAYATLLSQWKCPEASAR